MNVFSDLLKITRIFCTFLGVIVKTSHRKNTILCANISARHFKGAPGTPPPPPQLLAFSCSFGGKLASHRKCKRHLRRSCNKRLERIPVQYSRHTSLLPIYGISKQNKGVLIKINTRNIFTVSGHNLMQFSAISLG